MTLRWDNSLVSFIHLFITPLMIDCDTGMTTGHICMKPSTANHVILWFYISSWVRPPRTGILTQTLSCSWPPQEDGCEEVRHHLVSLHKPNTNYWLDGLRSHWPQCYLQVERSVSLSRHTHGVNRDYETQLEIQIEIFIKNWPRY